MDDRNRLLRALPKIDALLAAPEIAESARLMGRRAVAEICRDAVERAKDRAIESSVEPDPEAVLADAALACRRARSRILGRVVNGTGVLGHTNLGRAPLGREIFAHLADVASGYVNLEMDVRERRRGIRGPHVSSLLAQACETEDALVVNNNAAAVFLALSELAKGLEVAVSRGELIQIGGGFRIPEILERSGAILREVGTTNITTVGDFEAAIGERTGLILKVHHSNFRMEGFVGSPSVRDLAPLKTSDRILVCDLGSGNLAREAGPLKVREPTPADVLGAGADLVCFSCDKMLGGVQGGVVAGRRDLVDRLRRNHAMRIVRPGKLTYAALHWVLARHLSGERERIALWSLAAATREDLRARIERLLEERGLDRGRFEIVDSTATFGGGATPGEGIPSAAIRVRSDLSPDAVARWFQEREPPVIGTVAGGAFQVDIRAVLPEDEEALAGALADFGS